MALHIDLPTQKAGIAYSIHCHLFIFFFFLFIFISNFYIILFFEKKDDGARPSCVRNVTYSVNTEGPLANSAKHGGKVSTFTS